MELESGLAAERTSLASHLFAQMCLIREAENTLLDLFGRGKLSGTTHTSIGQEAIAVAVGSALADDDVVFSTHRCHGHFIAYGGSVTELFAEIMGRRSQICDGRGGSQHIHYKNFYSNGVQGGVIGNATGMALAERLKGSGSVVVAFMGDGTLGEGLVYESFNFASLKNLPILYVLENNHYSQSTPSAIGVSGSITARAAAFGIDAGEIESNDVMELHPLFCDRVAVVRRSQRPFLQVVDTYRLSPHSKGDDDRDPAEIESWRKRDPITILGARLPDAEAQVLEAGARADVAQAVADAEVRPFATAWDSRPLNVVPTGSYRPPWVTAEHSFLESINGALHRALETRPEVFVLGEDILDPYGGAFKVSKGLSTAFPDRVIPTPLSEAGIVAWGTGAALRGMRPIAEIMFGDFLMLAADQLANHASKYRWMYNELVEVPMVVRATMGARRGYGPTHSQTLEPLFMSLPGLCIVAPSHLLEAGELLLRCITETKDPVLFIENKLLYSRRLLTYSEGRLGEFFVRASEGIFPTLHLSLTSFEVPDVVVVCYGGSAPLAMEAAERLVLEHELSCDLVIPSLVSPLPVADVMLAIGSCKHVVLFEEGHVRGGWGAETIVALIEGGLADRRFTRVGAPDSPIPSSKSIEELLIPGVNALVSAVLAG